MRVRFSRPAFAYVNCHLQFALKIGAREGKSTSSRLHISPRDGAPCDYLYHPATCQFPSAPFANRNVFCFCGKGSVPSDVFTTSVSVHVIIGASAVPSGDPHCSEAEKLFAVSHHLV